MALNQLLNTAKGALDQATRAGRGAASAGIGLGKRVANRNPSPKAGMDDVTLARKVESELFQGRDIPKDNVVISVEEGVVVLRGQVPHPEDIRELDAAVRKIAGVEEVRNLLHLPKTPAPNKASSLGVQAKAPPTG